ncbi:MAG: tetratricopeptide repeat protein [Deltaproteobacteria bacterium]|jgi:tetratricopeptide (TPR) repeat protein|nr:tetratricopeptide repeat protein [Deltaproteobacteria bacterium]
MSNLNNMNILNKEKILELAKAFIDEGRLDKAIREYEKILLADPSDLRVKLRVAELHTKRKNVVEAIKLYKEVSSAYEDEGFFLKAVTVNKNILRLNPSLIEINEHLASLYERMGLIADAVRQYGILASALDSKGMAERALEIRAKIVGLVPEDGTARIRLAELYQREGRADEAIDQYEEYARQLEKKGGDKARLADLLEKIMSHRPERSDLLKKLIEIYSELNDRKKVIRWLEAGGDVVDTDPKMLRLMAEIYVFQNQNETARSKYIALAELHKERDEIDDALDAYQQILVILPDEEDRVEGPVEELRAGALKDIARKAHLRRQELEKEADEGVLAEDRQEKEIPEDKDIQENLPKAAAAQIEKVIEEESLTEISEDELPVDEDTISRNLKSAEASFDLGSAYKKMGLSDESKAEFIKAKDMYESLLDSVGDNDVVEGRLKLIYNELGVKPTKKEMNAPPLKREPTSKRDDLKYDLPSTDTKKTSEVQQKPKKKKISFV